jgi:hypothetical protein
VRDWLAELWVVFCYSTRTQLALALGVAFFAGIMLMGDALVGRIELHGSLAPLTDVIREALMHCYDKAAWMALFFRNCLGGALKTLEVLDNSDCTRKQAREAWDDVFDTDFFTEQPDNNGDGGSGNGSAMKVTSVETARRNDGGGRFG